MKLKKFLLLWNYWANLNQTLLKWSLGGPLLKLWPSAPFCIQDNGGHLGYKTVLTDTFLKGDHPRIISAKFGWDWLSSFRGEEFFLISSPLFLKKSSPLKLLSQSQPNFAEMILGWSPFKIVAVSTVLYPRWPLLLKIEISSNGQNCSILSQKVPKFELYKHNDELFNIYYGIFLWTLNFCRFWPIMQIRKKGGWN
jgi:hypothetical protein